MHTLKNLLLCSIALFLLSCSNDQPVETTPELDTTKLQGKWELTSALRNNHPTETLTGTYYFFNGDSVTTNLTPGGQDRSFLFESSGRTIRLKDQTEFMSFEIDSLSDSLLQMQTEIRGVKFQLSLKKQQPDSLETSMPGVN